MLPTPNPFHLKNTETAEEWRARRADVKRRTATNLGMPLGIAVQLLPTPTTQDGANNAGPAQHRRHSLPLNTAVTLLPTPDAYLGDRGAGQSREHRRKTGGHAVGLQDAVVAMDVDHPGVPDELYPEGEQLAIPMPEDAPRIDWGPYAEAIAQWADVLGRDAPAPTEPGRDGQPRLAARFVEWCMGLPDGWVTAVPGLSRPVQLRMLGNGVVPQHAAHAFTLLGVGAGP